MLFRPFPRTPERLRDAALSVLDEAFAAGATCMLPLFSGGHDSLSACVIASEHPRFEGVVHHIDTGIGSRRTRQYVEDTARELGWTLRVYQSPATYERFVRRIGFPGPGTHQWVYNQIKDRCVGQMTKGRAPKALVTGCRSQESRRRMGHVTPVQVGEKGKTSGIVSKRKRIWTAPCHDWSGEEQRAFMDAWALPRNPIKDSPLGMSGECFCGAFARPGELAMLASIVPDVAEEIARLTVIAREQGKPCQWGERTQKGKVQVATGPLCTSCDHRAALSGLLFPDGQ